VEVTCNWFSLYVLENVCGVKDAFRRKVGDLNHQRQMKRKHIENGRSFESLKNDPFLYLLMDYQLKEAFGWEPFMKITAGYRQDEATARESLPKNDAEKIDQYMVRFSEAVGRDLSGYFDDWGVPISDAARQRVADLPDWAPDF
ncbi:MAG: M60 family metallopeptidase, partial [Planctomycetia bacterium]|nr:M60 family metallopeptidase [Planctomycetia bacterium]